MADEQPTIPAGLCQCGCGRATEIATYTSRTIGVVKGQPRRFCRGHRKGGRPRSDRATSLPAETGIPLGTCQCGCGRETKPAPVTSAAKGWVKGRPVFYCKGHDPSHRAGFRAARGGLMWCFSCKRELSPASFSPQSKAKRARQDACKECQAKYAAEWRKKNRERFRRNFDSCFLPIKYGITLADYERMRDEQGGLCAICRQPETAKRRGVVMRLAVDHCHDTGKVRGLLCSSCNNGLGRFRSNPEVLESAARYLRAASG